MLSITLIITRGNCRYNSIIYLAVIRLCYHAVSPILLPIFYINKYFFLVALQSQLSFRPVNFILNFLLSKKKDLALLNWRNLKPRGAPIFLCHDYTFCEEILKIENSYFLLIICSLILSTRHLMPLILRMCNRDIMSIPWVQ